MKYVTTLLSRNSVQYVFRGDQRYIRTFIGGVLWNFIWFGIPLFILAGYYSAVIRNTTNIETDTPPEFTISDTFEMGVDGFKLLSVLLVYFLAPIALFYSLLAANVVSHGGFAVSEWPVAELLGVSIAVLLSYSVIVYVTPGVVIRVAETQQIRSGFNVKPLSKLWLSTTYAVTVGTFVLKSIVIGWVLITVPLVTLGLGAILYPFILFLYFTHISHHFGALKTTP